MKYTWFGNSYETYKPKINRKRQSILAGLVLGDIILPATFGLGCIAAKLITKFKPLYMYQ